MLVPVGLRRLSFATLVGIVAVIVWGALVRATGSGAGCGAHWPTCNGDIVPRAATLATAIELTHRLTTGALLAMVVGQLVWARRALQPGNCVRIGAHLTGVFIVTESLVGAGIVLLRYVARDSSPGRAAYLALHLTNTFLLLGVQTLTWWWARGGSFERGLFDHGNRRALRRALLPLVLTLLVAITGAIVALGDTLFPATSLAQGLAQDAAGSSHFLLRLRVVHPALAAGVGLWIVSRSLLRASEDVALRRLGRTLAALVTAQLGLGIVNLLLLAPTWMQLVHLFVADLVWCALVVFAIESLVASKPGVRNPFVGG